MKPPTTGMVIGNISAGMPQQTRAEYHKEDEVLDDVEGMVNNTLFELRNEILNEVTNMITNITIGAQIVRMKVTSVDSDHLHCLYQGQAVDVYPVWEFGSNDMGSDDVWPVYAANDYVAAFKHGGTWYTCNPVDDTDTC